MPTGKGNGLDNLDQARRGDHPAKVRRNLRIAKFYPPGSIAMTIVIAIQALQARLQRNNRWNNRRNSRRNRSRLGRRGNRGQVASGAVGWIGVWFAGPVVLLLIGVSSLALQQGQPLG
jgi:hypothetical protein